MYFKSKAKPRTLSSLALLRTAAWLDCRGELRSAAVARSPSPTPAAGAAGDRRATSLRSGHRRHQGHGDPFQQLGNGSQLTCSLLPPLEKGITATVRRGRHPSPNPGLGLVAWPWCRTWGGGGRTGLGDKVENSFPAPRLPCDPGTQDGNRIESPKLSDAPRYFPPSWASPRSTCRAAS